MWIFFLMLFSFKTNATPFYWGVGHSAFQAEGQPADSDWRAWTKTPGKIRDGSNADVVTNFWLEPEKDFAAAKELGANMFRLSIAWERVEPSPGQWDEQVLARYEEMISLMRTYGLEPMVTIQHFVLPQWLADKGGLLAEDFADRFAVYAHHVVSRLSKSPAQVKWWITINEPMVLVFGGYIFAEWPPGKNKPTEAYRAARNLQRAHNAAMKKVRSDKELAEGLQLSLAYHWRAIEATGFGIFNSVAQRLGNWIFNTWFLNGLDQNSLDFLAINYYGRSVLNWKWSWPFVTVSEGDGEKSDLNWVIYPKGLSESLKLAYQQYQLPIMITENGLADAADSQREKFLNTHIEQIQLAQSFGVPVLGYLHWSLTDNFEWAWGLKPRFGLIEVDYKTGERKPRPSFKFYRQLIKEKK